MKKLLVLSITAMGIGTANADFVYSNNASPGDTHTNTSASNQGAAVGDSGWFYNNTRNSGKVGINTTYARSGNGSAYLETVNGPGGASSKADIELLAGGINVGGNYYSTGIFCRLGDLSSVSYDWYRDSASTNSSVQMPAFRFLVDADGYLGTVGDRGGLVFELAYNGSVVPTDQWVTSTIDSKTKLWNFGLGVGNEFGGYRTLSEWCSGFSVGSTNSPVSANSLVIGFSSGVGSGWGPFKGAVDNISMNLVNGQTHSYNFEVLGESSAVPGPAAALPLALGLLAAAARKRRR